jgi:hypothetical protein
MPDNKVPLLSAIITAITLIFGCIFFSFSVLIALNGYSEREGLTILGLTILSQITSGILAVILARRTTIRLLTKSNWQNMPQRSLCPSWQG